MWQIHLQRKEYESAREYCKARTFDCDVKYGYTYNVSNNLNLNLC